MSTDAPPPSSPRVPPRSPTLSADASRPSPPTPSFTDTAGDIFTRRTAAWLVALSTVSLAATLLVLAFSGRMNAGDSAQADAFSRSSIGYRALVELLQDAGVDVVISRFRSAEKAGPHEPLLLAEPLLLDEPVPPRGDAAPAASSTAQPEGSPPIRRDSRHNGQGDPARGAPEGDDDAHGTGAWGLSAQLDEAARRDAPVVVVLPKHRGVTGPQEGWIEALDTQGAPEDALAILTGEDCIITDPPLPQRWKSALPGGEHPTFPIDTAPGEAPEDDPTRPLEPQLVFSDCPLEPLLWSDEGILLGKVPDRPVFIVSDPDLFNTWGLAHGDNAVIAHRFFVDHLGATSLVIDEITHGHYRAPSLWTELLTLPLLPVTLHAIGLTLLALIAASLRQSRAEPAPARVPAGKRALVDATAELLDGGAHHAETLRHYLRMTLRAAAASLGLPPGTDPLPALAALSRARGARVDIDQIAREVDAFTSHRGRPAAASALALARAIDTWRKEILDEPR
ncbi:hypothetical protein [Chondromyces apiculatus]|uniref:DUF4350 domain-containing protein n=1 Tax=Chondromyces apiculatus DSM 436 TaxID=1192034 RepID=A0A017T6J3_9BACT|nr:hypothetical protein [Chondromyces apiculatus]EYF04612.1 Hypothetical protein CAP_4288 [Chondromyces apiculatus DSM 436]